MKPLCVDLFCGLGGFSRGFIAEGYGCVGFDIERHDYGTGGYPGQLVLQDVTSLHGSQFKGADIIVASPPCQEFSFMAMPFSRGKQIAAALRGQGEFPKGYRGSRTIAELTRLFDACFRIQREAIEATKRPCVAWHGDGTEPKCARCNGTGFVTRHIPLIVENVRGAQPWVGRSKYNYGSFHLWGDVPALMPTTFSVLKSIGPQNANGELHRQGINKMRDAFKVPGLNFHEYEKTGEPGRSFQSAAVDGMKLPVGNCVEARWADRPIKRLKDAGTGPSARKAASAQIAKIPFELARWIASVHKPEKEHVA